MSFKMALLYSLFLLTPVRAEEPEVIPAAPTSPAPTGPIAPIPSDGWQTGTGNVSSSHPQQEEPAAPISTLRTTPKPGWTSFQVNAVLLLQTGGSNAFTGQLAWTPQWSMGKYTLRGELGLSVPKNTLGDLFLAVNYELLFRTHLNSTLLLDLGGGGQTWTGVRGVTQPIVTAQLSRRYDTRSVVDTVFFAYSHFFTTPRIHTFKLGVGFNL